MELLILLKMSFFVETVFPEKASITIYLMFLFAINIFEKVRAQFAFLILESKRVSLEICLTAPYYLFIVINFKRSVVFDTFKTMMLWNALDLTFYFFFYLFFFWFYFYFYFYFYFSLGRWRRHVTRKSHDMSHDVTS